MEQHVLSGWHLRSFADKSSGAFKLVAFDKTTGRSEPVEAKAFMTEVDAHSEAVETGFGQIEARAAAATQVLAKRVKRLPPGLYAITSPGAETKVEGDAVEDIGAIEGMRLYLGRHEIASPIPSHRLAIATYAGLMYQRAPSTEEFGRRTGIAYDRGVQEILDHLMPGMKSDLTTELAGMRGRMLTRSSTIGKRLAEATWWIARAPADEAFILGDSPVAATPSLGFDDIGWRAVFANDSFVVVMPMSPSIALLIATTPVMPVTGIGMDLAGLTSAINRLIWRRAFRYVLARNENHLLRAWPDASEEDRSFSGMAISDYTHGLESGRRDALRIIANVVYGLVSRQWQRWDGCRLVFGYMPWPSEDAGWFQYEHRDHAA